MITKGKRFIKYDLDPEALTFRAKNVTKHRSQTAKISKDLFY
jgi:hypothetical protein